MSNRTDILNARDAFDLLESKLAGIAERVESTGASIRIGRSIAMLRAARGELSSALNLPVDLVPLDMRS